MTIEQKALEEALGLALAAYEADKARHAAELREQAERFSEAVEQLEVIPDELVPFILAPDPLVEAVQDWWDADGYNDVANLRAALDARGLAIVKKEAVNG